MALGGRNEGGWVSPFLLTIPQALTGYHVSSRVRLPWLQGTESLQGKAQREGPRAGVSAPAKASREPKSDRGETHHLTVFREDGVSLPTPRKLDHAGPAPLQTSTPVILSHLS